MTVDLAVYILGVYTEHMEANLNLTAAQIITARIELDRKASKTAEERTVSAWLAEAFDRIAPAASAAMDRIFDGDFAGTYGEAMQLAYQEVTAP